MLAAGSAVDVSLDGQYATSQATTAGLKVLDRRRPDNARPASRARRSRRWCDVQRCRQARIASPTSGGVVHTSGSSTWLRPYASPAGSRGLLSVRTARGHGPCATASSTCAEDYRFQVVNVARPRQPQVVGTCGLPERSTGLCRAGHLRLRGAGVPGLVILSVARPDAPSELGRYQSVRRRMVSGSTIRIAYIAELRRGLTVASVASPRRHELGSRLTPGWAYDVIVVGQRRLRVGCYSTVIRVYDVRNPT